MATIATKTFLANTSNFLVNELAQDECQHITFSIGGTQFSFANVHMDSHQGTKRAALCTALQGALPIGTIIGGDFNMVQDPDLDTQRPHSANPHDNGGWQEMVSMQSTLQISDLWREENGDTRLFTHESHVQGGITRTRIDFVLCPCHAMVGHCAITTSHDYEFWQGNGRADHIGVTVKVAPVDPTKSGPKNRAAPPHVFETHEWHTIHAAEWEKHILAWPSFHTTWEWWEAWKPIVVELARSHMDRLTLAKSKQQRHASHMARLAHEFAAQCPGQHADMAVSQAKELLDEVHVHAAKQGKRARLTHGIDMAAHMHPAFLAQAKETRTGTTVPCLDKWSTYFGDQPTQVGQTTNEPQKLEEANKFYNELHAYQEPCHDSLTKVA